MRLGLIIAGLGAVGVVAYLVSRSRTTSKRPAQQQNQNQEMMFLAQATDRESSLLSLSRILANMSDTKDVVLAQVK